MSEGEGEGNGRGTREGDGATRTVEERTQSVRENPKVTGDRAALEKMLREAEAGDPGAMGELEAIERWLAEGREVEVLPERQNAGVKNPDYRVDGEVVEVKSRTESLSKRWIKDQIRSANQQVEQSGLGEQGAVELQLREQAAESATLEGVERQVRGQFNENRSGSLNRVSVYRNGELLGEWIRQLDGSVTRTYPP